MNLTDYIQLLNHPESIVPRDTEALDNIVTEFPYFQSARALRLKGLYNEDSFRYNFALKVTAGYTTDRSVLFDFITSDTFTSVNGTRDTVKTETAPASATEQIEIAANIDAVPSLELTQETISLDDFEPVMTSPTLMPDASEEVSEEIQTEEQEEQNEELLAEVLREYTTEQRLSDPELIAPLPPQTPSEPFYTEPDPATKSVLDSIKEANAGLEVSEETAEEIIVPEPATSEEKTVETMLPMAETQSLELGKPLDFSQNEKHSFQEWLQLSQIKPILREQEPPIEKFSQSEEPQKQNTLESDSERQKKNELIDRFIETNPRIQPVKPATPIPTSLVIEPSRAVDNSYLMTETLARVYLEQKKYEKAIQAYEILILKYPEKSSFFADRILDIRNLQQKQ